MQRSMEQADSGKRNRRTSHKKQLILAAMLFLLLWPLTLLASSDHTDCRAPMVLRNRQVANLIVSDWLDRTGGLPGEGPDLEESSTKVFHDPVHSWEVERLTVGNTQSLIASLRDDDPIYTYTIDFRVLYRDGSEQRFRLSSWRYGLVVCPFVLVSGDGPPGNLVMLHEQNR
jgi:hypothetical protein